MSTQTPTQVHEAVKTRYAAIATAFEPDTQATCCDDGGACCADDLYAADLTTLPDSVTGLSLGCGDPITLAELQPGQRVLDLGSGGGIDCFLAAERVGEHGYVIGVDMTEAMLERANANKARLGVNHVEFRHGHIEALPVDADSIDVIISNCVINLSPDKAAVFKEAYRVLTPGGKVAVSDMVTQGKFTEQQRNDMGSWADCVSGAEDVADMVGWMRDAGFADISVRDKHAPDIELADSIALPGAPARLFSARITACKPGLSG
ncbi:MAG: arsenite methyltransferase [Anaerolineae bacterium]|nr:arsenite methyltransferase [Anaerolineae bacterium]